MKNPHILPLFSKFALEAHNAGLHHYGAKEIAERVRWHMQVETSDVDFKMNNNYISRIARDLIADKEHGKVFQQLFHTRRLQSE